MDIFEERIVRGYEPIKEGNRVGFEMGRVGRFKVKPSVLAAYNLFKVLEKYPEFTKEARGQNQKYYEDMEGLETMNLEAFASVLTFLKNYPAPTPENFEDATILQYFSRLLPKKEVPDKANIILRLKVQFLKYIVAINTYKQEKEEFLEDAFEGEYEEEEDYEEEDDYSE